MLYIRLIDPIGRRKGSEKRLIINRSCIVAVLIIVLLTFCCGCSDATDDYSDNNRTTENAVEETEKTTDGEKKDTESLEKFEPGVPSDEEIDNALLDEAQDAYEEYIDDMMDPGFSQDYDVYHNY